MVRPIEGFMSEDGKFFETEALCELYEAKLAVTTLVRDELSKVGMNFTPEGQRFLSDWIISMVTNNIDVFVRQAKADPIPVELPDNDIRATELEQEVEKAAPIVLANPPHPEERMDDQDLP